MIQEVFIRYETYEKCTRCAPSVWNAWLSSTSDDAGVSTGLADSDSVIAFPAVVSMVKWWNDSNDTILNASGMPYHSFRSMREEIQNGLKGRESKTDWKRGAARLHADLDFKKLNINDVCKYRFSIHLEVLKSVSCCYRDRNLYESF